MRSGLNLKQKRASKLSGPTVCDRAWVSRRRLTRSLSALSRSSLSFSILPRSVCIAFASCSCNYRKGSATSFWHRGVCVG